MPKKRGSAQVRSASAAFFEQLPDFVLVQPVEIIGDHELALEPAEDAFPRRRGERTQACERLAPFRDDDLLAGGSLFNQPR